MSAGKVLIPLWRNEIAPRFDLAREAMVVVFDEDKVLSSDILVLARPSGEGLCELALRESCTDVITNAIEARHYDFLRFKRIRVHDGVLAELDSALAEVYRQESGTQGGGS